MSKKKEYAIAIIIIEIGCLISALILFAPKPDKSENKPPSVQVQESMPNEDSEVTTPEHTELTELNKYTINFHDENGAIIKTSTVDEGCSILPPKYENDGGIFKGWSQLLFSVASDMEVYPQWEAFDEAKNIVYANASYTDKGNPLEVSVMLAGEVDLCDFVVELEYDSDLLSFSASENEIDGLTIVDNIEEGKIIFTYNGESITQQTKLADISFGIKPEGMYSSKLVFATKEIHKKNDAGMVEYTDSVAYETNIFILN